MLSQHILVTPNNHAPWHVTSCHLFSLLGVGTCENCFDHLKERHRQKKLSVIFFERMGRAIFNRANIGVVSKAWLGENFWEMGSSAYGHSWAHRNHQELNWTETCLSLGLLTWQISYYNNNKYVFNVLNPSYHTCVKLKVLYMQASSKIKFMVGCSFFRCLHGTGWWFHIVRQPTAVACSTWPWITATTWRRWTWKSLWRHAVEDW